jgi:hypothetical protein
MTRVRVDFNSRGPGGLVRGSRRRADADLVEGDRVELYDPDEEDMVFFARVAKVDPETGKALFEVEWDAAQPPIPAHGVVVHAAPTFSNQVITMPPRRFNSWPARVSTPVAL